MKKLDTKVLCKNICNAYKQAANVDKQAGNFYEKAHEICIEFMGKYGVTTNQAAGIIAVLSPGTFWEQNIKDTEAFLQGKRKGFATYGQFVTKAVAILVTTDITAIYEIVYGKQGYKTASFFLNIIGNYTSITIDRHAYRVATNTTDTRPVRMTIGQYKKIEAAYILAGKKLGICPVKLQAITWHQYKRVNDRGNYSEDCPF